MAITQRPSWRGGEVLVVSALCVFVTVLCNHLVAPVVVDIGREFALPVPVVGQLVTVYSFSGTALALVVGPLLDRYGRRRVALWGFWLMFMGALGTALAEVFWALLLFWGLVGLAGAAVQPAGVATVGDRVPYERRGKAMGYLSGAGSLAVLLGVPLGTLLAGLWGWRFLFGFVALLLAAGVLLVWSAFPQDPPRAPSAPEAGPFFGNYRQILGHRSSAGLLLAAFLIGVFNVAWNTYFGAFYIETFGLTTRDLAPIFLGVGMVQLVGSVLAGFWGDRWGNKPMLLAWLASMALLFPLQTNLPLLGPTLAVTLVLNLPNGARHTNESALVSEQVPELRGTITALNLAMLRLGSMVGAALGGGVVGGLGYQALGVVAGVFVILAMLCIWFLVQERRVESPPPPDR